MDTLAEHPKVREYWRKAKSRMPKGQFPASAESVDGITYIKGEPGRFYRTVLDHGSVTPDNLGSVINAADHVVGRGAAKRAMFITGLNKSTSAEGWSGDRLSAETYANLVAEKGIFYANRAIGRMTAAQVRGSKRRGWSRRGTVLEAKARLEKARAIRAMKAERHVRL